MSRKVWLVGLMGVFFLSTLNAQAATARSGSNCAERENQIRCAIADASSETI
jgi:hypothetical protein